MRGARSLLANSRSTEAKASEGAINPGRQLGGSPPGGMQKSRRNRTTNQPAQASGPRTCPRIARTVGTAERCACGAVGALSRETRIAPVGVWGWARADRRSRLTREQEAGEATGEGPRRVGLTTGTRGQARVVRSVAGQSFASLLPAVRRERFTARFDRVSPSSRVPDPGHVFLWPLPAGRRRGSLLPGLTRRPRHARAVQVQAVGRIGGKGALYSCSHCHLPLQIYVIFFLLQTAHVCSLAHIQN